MHTEGLVSLKTWTTLRGWTARYFNQILCKYFAHKWGPHRWTRKHIGGPYAIDGFFAHCVRCCVPCKGHRTKVCAFFAYEDRYHPWRRLGWRRGTDGFWRSQKHLNLALSDYDRNPDVIKKVYKVRPGSKCNSKMRHD